MCVCVRICVCVYMSKADASQATQSRRQRICACVCACVCVWEKGCRRGEGGGRTSNEDDKGLGGDRKGFRGAAVVGRTVAQGLGFKMPPSAQLPPPPAAASMSASRGIQGIAATR